MSRTAIYPGSFDPATNGHLSIIRRGLAAFDTLVVAVANNTQKTHTFTIDERVAMLQQAVQEDPVLKGTPRVIISSFQGLLVDFARKSDAKLILRGLRAVSDFEYEFHLANMNRKLAPDIDTMFMMTDKDEFYISSRFVRDAASLGADVESLVPAVVWKALSVKFKK